MDRFFGEDLRDNTSVLCDAPEKERGSMIEKCKTCLSGYLSVECVNCGTGLRNYRPYKPPTNAGRIRSMSDEELAELLSQVAYAMYTPWAESFSRTFCDDCPVTAVKLEGYYHEMNLHECDFTDGKCPHGDDIMYWLQSSAEMEDKSGTQIHH